MIKRRKDIFGNTTTYQTTGSQITINNYKQKLKYQKQKDAYIQYMQQKREQQLLTLKQAATQSTQFIKQRTQTLKQTEGIKNKLKTLITGKKPSIYEK